MIRRSAAFRAVLAAGAAALVLAGCADVGSPLSPPTADPGAATPAEAAAPTEAGDAETATPDATSVPEENGTDGEETGGDGETEDPVLRMAGGNGSALPLMVPTSALPSGWSATPARNTGGYRMSVCEVDLEPVEPVDGAQQNWRSADAATHLEQHVRVYPDDTAQDVITALGEAIEDCTEYTAEDASGGSSTFTVQPLSLDGAPDGTVAWRQRVAVPVPGTDDAGEVVQDVTVSRRGAAIVLLNAYRVGGDPGHEALTAALDSLP